MQVEFMDLKLRPQHLTTLAKWHFDEWSHLNPGQSFDERVDDMKYLLNSDFIPSMYIIESQDCVVGSAGILKHDMDIHKNLSPWLASVYIDKKHRGKGFGKEMVLYTMQQARMNGIDTLLYLYTPDQEEFYLKLGWETLMKEKYHGEVVTIMSVNLKRL